MDIKYTTPIEETMEALHNLVKAGKVRAIGASALALVLMLPLDTFAKDQQSDYTIIFCSMPERVEQFAIEDYADILRMRENGEISSNISVSGLLKFGEGRGDLSWQKELAQYGYDGTLYIDLGQKNGHEILPVKDDTLHAAVSYIREFNALKYADKYYKFFNTDSLAILIRKVASAHPAKNYVLVLQGHGNGQYCMRDDYYPNRRGITAEELKEAIDKSGIKLHTLLFHNCMMGTLENLAVYQHCAKYALISPNETCGAYLAHFIANLSKAGSNPDKTVELLRETIDFYNTTADKDDEIDTSLGCYDLSKVKRLLKTVKNISAWYNNAMNVDSALIDSAVITTITADHDTLTQNDIAKSDRWVYNKLILAHFIHQTIAIASSNRQHHETLNIRQLEALYEKYLAQLKDMAHIRCNHVKKSTEDYNYLYASPSVSVFSMNKETQSNYKNSQFDRMTLWSRFLEKLQVNPSYQTNPYRNKDK